jgi:hypothetical protein
MPVTRDLSHLPSQISYNITENERSIARTRAARKLLLSPAYLDFWSSINDQFPIGYTGNNGNIYLYLKAQGFTYTDNPELFTLLDGFDVEKIEVRDQPNASYREYRCSVSILKQEFQVIISVELTDNAICQRVIVREEEVEELVRTTVRKPVYAFKC